MKKLSRDEQDKLKYEVSTLKGRHSELLDIEYENGGLTPEEQTEYDTTADRIGAIKRILPKEMAE
jgi:hypothetical protein